MWVPVDQDQTRPDLFVGGETSRRLGGTTVSLITRQPARFVWMSERDDAGVHVGFVLNGHVEVADPSGQVDSYHPVDTYAVPGWTGATIDALTAVRILDVARTAQLL